MKIKAFIIILILSAVITYGGAIVDDFVFNIFPGSGGFPFSFSSFGFLGAQTNMGMLLLDIIFWFLVIWGIWKLLQKSKKKKKK